MKSSFLSESPCDEQHFHGFNPQSWLQVERGKLRKSSYSPSSIESLIKIAEPPVVPLYKPLDYVEVLSRIHEELEQCMPSERPGLYLIQSQVFRGLGEAKLRQRSLHSAWRCAGTVHEKVIFGAWLRYEKRGEEIISDVLASCWKCCREFGPLDIASEMPVGNFEIVGSGDMGPSSHISSMVTFQIRDGRVACDRCKIASLSIPFCSMLNGPFTESQLELVDLSENGISLEAMRAVSEFSCTCSLEDLPLEILLEILVFADTFCCDKLKDACDRKLASFVSSRQDAVELMALAFEENAPVLAASCLQMLLQELPDCITDELVVSLLLSATEQQQLIMVGHASFLLYCLLSEVAMNIDPRTETTVCLSEKLVQLAVTPTQKQIAFHQLGCIRLLRKECNEAEHQFEVAFSAGHGYSMAGLARIAGIKGKKVLAYEKLSSVITSSVPLGWMHLVRILHDGKSLGQLQKLLFMSSIEIKPWPPPLLKRIEVIRVAQQKQGFLPDARAYWVTRSLIAWEVSDRETSLCLYASRDATMRMSNGVIEGYDSKVELQPEHAGLPAGVTQKFPFISSYRAFRVPSSVDVAGLAKCQLAVSSFDADGKHQDVTGLQLPDVLDDMFAYTGPLGAVFGEEAVSLYLWAPTAQDVSVCFYDGPVGALLETLQLKELNGVGSVTGPKDWENRYYLYEVKVYHPSTSQIEKCLADDPYARGVSANGSRTWLVDIDSETLKPTSWDELVDEKPNLDSFSDKSIYELHIRDFSAHNSTMDCNSQGGFRDKIVPGFTVLDVDGEEPHTGIVASISNDNTALISCVDDERLGSRMVI